MNNFQSKYGHKASRYISPKKLLGRFSIALGQYNKAIKYYQEIINEQFLSDVPNKLLVDHSNYNLGVAYSALGKYDSAAICTINKIVYDSRFKGQAVSWETLTSDEIIHLPYSFPGFGRLAGYYTRFFESGTGNLNDLKRAYQLYRIMDTTMFKQTGIYHENLPLTFFMEVGNDVYPNGVKTCYLLYKETGEREYLDMANVFIERTKSTILYSDMLTNSEDFYPGVPDSLIDREKRIKQKNK